MTGFIFIPTAVSLALVVSFVVTLLELRPGAPLMRPTLRRWGKFLLGLAGLAAVVQVLSLV